MHEVITILKKISIPYLAGTLGNKNAKVIESMGFPINSDTLAEALFLNKGTKIFKAIPIAR